MPISAIIALEVGTTKTTGMVAFYSPKNNTTDIVAVHSAKTVGIKKGEVTNPTSVTTTIESVINTLETSAQADINCIHLVYSGGNLQAMPITGRTLIENPSEVVEDEDIENALENMRDMPLQSGRTTLEEMQTQFILDGTRPVDDPSSIGASELTVNGIRTHVDTNSYRSIVDSVEDAECYIENVYSAACCAPLGCTTREQRQHGVLVINFGGGVTSWCVMRDDKILHVGHLPIGGDHVTNDILCAFRAGTDESATALKHDFAQATLSNIDPTERVTIPKNLGMKRTINRKALCMVVNARMDETLRIIYKRVYEEGLLDSLGAGIVLCGGASLLRELPALTSQIFDNIPCVVGTLPHINVERINEDPYNICYATVYGTIQRAVRIEAEKYERGGNASWISRFFSKRQGGRR